MVECLLCGEEVIFANSNVASYLLFFKIHFTRDMVGGGTFHFRFV
jgi:hypothetical protein